VRTTWSYKRRNINTICTNLPSIGRFLRINNKYSLSPSIWIFWRTHILLIKCALCSAHFDQEFYLSVYCMCQSFIGIRCYNFLRRSKALVWTYSYREYRTLYYRSIFLCKTKNSPQDTVILYSDLNLLKA
jgi:hypothetical protein